MADVAETDASVLDSAEGCKRSHPSQGFEGCSTAIFSGRQDSKEINSGSHSLKRSRKKAKARSSARCGPSSESTLGGGVPGVTSAGSVKSEGCFKLPKPKIDLRALFDYYFVRKQHRKRKRRWEGERKTARTRNRRKPPEGQWPKIPVDQRKKRYRERGLRFPFVEKLCGRKHIPFKLVCRYEQEALQGYFRYLETLKYEHHLKQSLTKLNAGDDLERESLESRKYKYLDDDGPLSPIEETIDEDQNENFSNNDLDARIVEKSSFILSSKIPKRKKPKKKCSVLENKWSENISVRSQERNLDNVHLSPK